MEEFTELLELMETLRGEQGCSWDKKQTEKAFRTFLLEEVYEAVDAIEREDSRALKEELGDLLFHIVFIAQICKEKHLFSIEDVITGVTRKMYGRHPHVFRKDGDTRSIEVRWEELKKNEKADYAPLSDVPKVLPALLRAYVVSRRAARVGFDWEDVKGVYGKLDEEIEELKDAETSGKPEEIEEEIGDLLFTVVNLARFNKIDPEAALRRTIDKFITRFQHLEKHLDLGKSDLKAMDALWEEIKQKEKKGR